MYASRSKKGGSDERRLKVKTRSSGDCSIVSVKSFGCLSTNKNEYWLRGRFRLLIHVTNTETGYSLKKEDSQVLPVDSLIITSSSG